MNESGYFQEMRILFASLLVGGVTLCFVVFCWYVVSVAKETTPVEIQYQPARTWNLNPPPSNPANNVQLDYNNSNQTVPSTYR